MLSLLPELGRVAPQPAHVDTVVAHDPYDPPPPCHPNAQLVDMCVYILPPQQHVHGAPAPAVAAVVANVAVHVVPSHMRSSVVSQHPTSVAAVVVSVVPSVVAASPPVPVSPQHHVIETPQA